MFDPHLSIGQIINNEKLKEIFKCGNMGGMRRSHATNTLVIVSDYTKGLYHDKWISGNLHYTGMGKSGDQDINFAQNRTLADCMTNGVDVHLFEVMDPGEYTYCGHIELVAPPYQEIQEGEDGLDRKVWMFPVRPVPENDVKKPKLFVFTDINDYRNRWKAAEDEYRRLQVASKKKRTKQKPSQPTPVELHHVLQTENPKPIIVLAPTEVLGKKVMHNTWGEGTITKVDGPRIEVAFDSGTKKLGYKECIEKEIIQIHN